MTTTTTTLMPEGRQRYYNNDGTPCAGGQLWTYAAGTTNPKTTYADADGTTPNPNPVPLDAHGEAVIFWSGAYKVDLKQADGQQVTGYPVDNFRTDPAGTWALLTKLSTLVGAALIGWSSAGTGSTVQTALDMLYHGVANVMSPQFAGGAKCDGATDDWAAIQAAINSGAPIIYIPGRCKTSKTLTGMSQATAPIKLIGQGVGASIIDFAPAAYSAANDTAVWFGNNTDNRPASVYQCCNLTIEDLSIYVNANARVGLRLREAQHTSVKRVFIGPETWDTVTNLTCLFIDGGVHGNYEMLDLAPRAGYTTNSPNLKALRIQNSATLDRSAGSGSGAGITSSSFRNCYLHYAGIVAEVYSANEVLFDSCIFEACQQGVQLYDVFLPQFNNCYYEAINTYPICANGVDVRAVCNVVVSGGYYQANGKSGYNNDSFIYANNAGKITVRDVQMFGAVAVGQLVTVAGTCHSIQIDAKPYPQYGAGTGNVETAATNPFATTAGSKEIIVTQANHGRVVGDTVGFRGFTTPINAIPVNQQYCKVTAVVDANTFRVLSLVGATVAANATGSALGGTGTIVYYPPNTWANAVIAQPNRTRFNDADIVPVTFQRAFTAALSAANLYLQNDPAMTGYLLDKWTYVMYAYKFTNIAQTAAHTNYCYLFAQYPNGYEQALILNTVDGSIPANSLRGADMALGYKFPPGTVLSVQVWDAGGVGGVNYTKTDGVRVFIAPCNDEYYVG